MTDPALTARLERLEEHLSLALHEYTRRRGAIQQALTRLRTGQAPAVVAAILESECPELREEVGR